MTQRGRCAVSAPLAAGVEWGLGAQHLPDRSWPEPEPLGWSPFSQSGKDYVRVIGPGVYVGCAYRTEPERPNDLVETNFVYFIFARKY